MPSAVRARIAFCTVTGLAPYSSISARLDGTCAPGGACAIQSRSPASIREALSLGMTQNSSATLSPVPALSLPRAGLWWGFLGVFAFSFTVVFTRVAVDGLAPLFIGSGRAVIAALLAIAALALTRQRAPTRRQWLRLAIVA